MRRSGEPGFWQTGKCPDCAGTGIATYVNPEWLVWKRHQLGLGVREMARRCGVSAPFVSDVEHGRRNWSERLAVGYGVSVTKQRS